MAQYKYKFSHRARGRYYWTRRLAENPGYEEQVSCSVLWFWDQITSDITLPPCNCNKQGSWGATGLMPDDRHCLVVTKTMQYLAHIPDCNSRGPRIGEDGQPVCRRRKGHRGKHRPNPDDGWGPDMSWGLSTGGGWYV